MCRVPDSMLAVLQEHAAVVEALKLHVLTADEEKSVLLLDLQSFHAAAQV